MSVSIQPMYEATKGDYVKIRSQKEVEEAIILVGKIIQGVREFQEER